MYNNKNVIEIFLPFFFFLDHLKTFLQHIQMLMLQKRFEMMEKNAIHRFHFHTFLRHIMVACFFVIQTFFNVDRLCCKYFWDKFIYSF